MKLFISYRSLDSAKVDALVKRLQGLTDADGNPLYEIWQDKHSIPPAKDWWVAIVEGIIECDVFIYMLSAESAQNLNCRAELSYARKRNRPILPFVLEGEHRYNTTTGKYDLDYWDDVPQELQDTRVQMLFDEGVKSLNQLVAAIDKVMQNPPPDIPAPFPPDPRHASDPTNDTVLIYDQACDYAGRLEFDTAERLFQRLLNMNDPLFGQDSHDWILIIREYQQLIRLDARKNTRHKIPKLWKTYAGKFPKDFIAFFDPKGFLTQYGASKIVPHDGGASNVDDRRGGFANPPLPEKSTENRSPQLQSQSQVRQPTTTNPSSLDLMPAPFAWVDIPVGQVTLEAKDGYYGGGQTFNVDAFQIAKYPVTNAQFAKFIDAGGYENRQWWTDAGWDYCQNENLVQPRFWTEAEWNGAAYPVVGVSWYESVAFCLWLSEVTGEKIMLPSEVQWQRAAQGDDGREYPWGNDWDKTRCNNNVGNKGTGKTTPVTDYEGKGDSPYGVVDMSGNVWEWCLTQFENGSQDLNSNNSRVLRGGSWYYDVTDVFRVAFRSGFIPNARLNGWGFRVSRSY